MTGKANQTIDIMLVLPGEELWGAERLRADLAAAGLRLMLQEEFRTSEPLAQRMPAAILVFLSGQFERDAAICRKWVEVNLAPVIAVSANAEEGYVLALFTEGVEDVIRRPIRSRELAARIRSILRRTQPDLRLHSASNASAAPAIILAPKRDIYSLIHGLQKQFEDRKKAKGEIS